MVTDLANRVLPACRFVDGQAASVPRTSYFRSLVCGPAAFQPIQLDRCRDAFDHPDWLFEPKYDGFRSLAFVIGGGTKLVSRRGLTNRHRFTGLGSAVTLEPNADDAVLDGEIVKLDDLGDLMRRRGPFAFKSNLSSTSRMFGLKPGRCAGWPRRAGHRRATRRLESNHRERKG
jgi:ATP-dependent DNA ligase